MPKRNQIKYTRIEYIPVDIIPSKDDMYDVVYNEVYYKCCTTCKKEKPFSEYNKRYKDRHINLHIFDMVAWLLNLMI